MSAMSQEIYDRELEGQGSNRLEAEHYEKVKFILERVLAVILLVIFSPVILLALFLVRITSRGPALYTQPRSGLDGQLFTILKIRSMYLESEVDGPKWCVPGDRRITPIGRFLRWCHFDELPQLVNVIRGEMSLIGPRPERPEIIAQLERTFSDYGKRLTIRPGLTGLAQVLQGPDTDLGSVRRKLNFDLYYVDQMSLWLDLRILIATALLFALSSSSIAGLMGLPGESLHLRAESAA